MALFLMMGPPPENPLNWFCRSSPFFYMTSVFEIIQKASSLSLREELPRRRGGQLLVPDLIVALRTAAPDRPNSALKSEV